MHTCADRDRNWFLLLVLTKNAMNAGMEWLWKRCITGIWVAKHVKRLLLAGSNICGGGTQQGRHAVAKRGGFGRGRERGRELQAAAQRAVHGDTGQQAVHAAAGVGRAVVPRHRTQRRLLPPRIVGGGSISGSGQGKHPDVGDTAGVAAPQGVRVARLGLHDGEDVGVLHAEPEQSHRLVRWGKAFWCEP